MARVKCIVCGEDNKEGEFFCKACRWPIGWLEIPFLTEPSPEWRKGFEKILSLSRQTYNELKESRNKLKEAENLLTEKENIIKNLEKKQKELQQELEKLKEKLKTFEQKLSKKEREIADKKREIENLKRNNAELQRKIEKFTRLQSGKSQKKTITVRYSLSRINEHLIRIKLLSTDGTIPPTKFVFNPQKQPLKPTDGKIVVELPRTPKSAIEQTVNFSERGYSRPFSEESNVIFIPLENPEGRI